MLDSTGIDHIRPEQSRPGDFLPAIGIVLIGGVILSAMTLSIETMPGHYLVIARSATEAARVAYRAGGMVIDTSGVPNAVIAVAGETDDFKGALRMNGAWLVLPAPTAGCFAR